MHALTRTSFARCPIPRVARDAGTVDLAMRFRQIESGRRDYYLLCGEPVGEHMRGARASEAMT